MSLEYHAASTCAITYVAVYTKDSDFVDSLLVHGQPWKLLLVTTGNIHNRELEALFLANLETIINGLNTYTYVELSRSAVILHF